RDIPKEHNNFPVMTDALDTEHCSLKEVLNLTMQMFPYRVNMSSQLSKASKVKFQVLDMTITPNRQFSLWSRSLKQNGRTTR
uniref:Uncharacterized protein n=1 Tax=Amphimedon queenslandica TaxID=400682 RepID=A0A1X7UKT4_AMPQE